MTATVLVVGAGGVGAPCALALAHAGEPLRLLVADDDAVERSNLHRQILFEEADVGRPKLDALKDALGRIAPSLAVGVVRARLLPDTAIGLVERADIVVDASDNFATRFLVADAARIVERPVVHAAAVRWQATVLSAGPRGRPCYRCLFEDLPVGPTVDCSTAGIVGPVCGVAGALAAELVLRIARGHAGAFGWIHTYDGRRDRLRRVEVRPRAECPLCGAPKAIRDIDPGRYAAPLCDSI